MRAHLAIPTLAFVFFCISCGGGGGGGGEETGIAVDTNQALVLTSSNAPPVAGLVADTALGGVTAGSFGTGVIASADSVREGEFELNLLHLTQDSVNRVWEMQLQGTLATAGVSAAQVPASAACTIAGAVNASWRDADSVGELSVGDNITLTFDNCVEADLTLNGGMDVGILSIDGDPAIDPEWTVQFRLNFNSLTASDGGTNVQVAGSLDATVATLTSGEIITDITTEVATGPGSTTSSFLYFGEGVDFTELTLYRVRFQENTDGTYRLSAQGTLESSFIGGTVTFETTREVAGTGFDVNNPSAGEMLIVGAANSSVLLRIVDSVVVELDLDEEGDGFDVDDVTLTSSWDDLNAAVDAL